MNAAALLEAAVLRTQGALEQAGVTSVQLAGGRVKVTYRLGRTTHNTYANSLWEALAFIARHQEPPH
jgi:hypothetical protein